MTFQFAVMCRVTLPVTAINFFCNAFSNERFWVMTWNLGGIFEPEGNYNQSHQI